jgi:phosphoribosylformylglycinamidine synthase I
MRPIAVLTASGTNRDGEAVRALRAAGAEAELAPVGTPLHRYGGLVLPGGFSYGDALGAGTRWAMEIGEVVARFVEEADRPVLGICNGFQALVRAGLLPGPAGAPRQVTLTTNADGRFVCRWVELRSEPGNRAGIDLAISCPVAHHEGRLAVAEPAVADELTAAGQVLFRYTSGTNPNGSVGDIAGLCDATGTVWGLMPHPEDHLTAEQHPFPDRPGRVGLALFEAFVARAGAH